MIFEMYVVIYFIRQIKKQAVETYFHGMVIHKLTFSRRYIYVRSL